MQHGAKRNINQITERVATWNALNMTRATHHTPRQREERPALNFSRRVHPCGNPKKTCEKETARRRLEREDRGWQVEVGGRAPFCHCPLQAFHNVSSRVVARSASDFQIQSPSPGYPCDIPFFAFRSAHIFSCLTRACTHAYKIVAQRAKESE